MFKIFLYSFDAIQLRMPVSEWGYTDLTNEEQKEELSRQ